jgi:hypothetical protein
VIATAACTVVMLSACGGDDDAPSGGRTAELTVTVWPQGPDGPARRHRVVCPGDAACRGLSASRLRPTPANVACTEIYGGPAVARVRGTLDGKPVDVRLDRTNGCEIARWERNALLLKRR